MPMRAPHDDPLKTLAQIQEPVLLPPTQLGSVNFLQPYNNPRDLPSDLAWAVPSKTANRIDISFPPFPV
jgi:hypothetical protein